MVETGFAFFQDDTVGEQLPARFPIGREPLDRLIIGDAVAIDFDVSIGNGRVLASGVAVVSGQQPVAISAATFSVTITFVDDQREPEKRIKWERRGGGLHAELTNLVGPLGTAFENKIGEIDGRPLNQRFLGSNHIRPPRRVCRTMYGRLDGD